MLMFVLKLPNEHCSFSYCVRLFLCYPKKSDNAQPDSKMTTAPHSETIQKEIDLICDKMIADKEKVSVRAVLAKFEGLSSVSQMHKYVTDWRNRTEAKEKELYDRLGFSSEFTKAFLNEITRFSAEAETRSAQSLSDMRRQLSDAIEDLEREERSREQYQTLAHQREKEITALEQQIETDTMSHQHEVDSLSKDQEHAIAQIRGEYEARLSEVQKQLDSARTKNNELSGTVETLRRDLAQAQVKLEQIPQLESTNTTLLSGSRELNEKVSDLKADLASMRKELEGKDRLIASLEAAQAKMDARYESLDESIADSKATIAKLQGERDSLKDQITALNKELAEERKPKK